MVVKAGREKWRGAGCGLSRCLSRFCRRGASVQCVQCAVRSMQTNLEGKGGGGTGSAGSAGSAGTAGAVGAVGPAAGTGAGADAAAVAQALGCLVRVENPFFFPLPGATTTKTRQRDHHLSLTATGSLMELPLHKLYRLQWMGEILFPMKKDRNHGIVSTRVNQQVWFVQYRSREARSHAPLFSRFLQERKGRRG